MDLGYPISIENSKLQYTMDNCRKLQTYLEREGNTVWPKKIDTSEYENQQLSAMITPDDSTMGKENQPRNNPGSTKTGGRKKKKRKTRRKKKKSYLKKSRKRKNRRRT